jgi:superfamily II DNA/RNA helicase
MIQPTHIRAELPAESAVHQTTTQFVYRAHALDKIEMLARVLQARERGLTMVFTRTKRTAAKVADELSARGFAAAAVHGDLGQGAREQALRAFRSGKVDVLVATDVAARGIDVDDVTHVLNYQCPDDEKTYIHRIGRTGRAGKSGVAVSFIDWDDLPRWALINEALGLGIGEPPETYSTSPHLYAELDIPTDVAGTLPQSKRLRAGLAAEEVEDLGETGRGRRGGSGSRSRSIHGPRQRTPGGRREREHQGETPAAATPVPTPSASEDGAPRRRRRRRTRGGSLQSAGPSGESAE